MKLISVFFLLPFIFLIGCGGSSETVIIVEDPAPIQTYTIEVIDIQGVVDFPATDFSVEISNIYSSDVVEAREDIAIITDENDDVPMTFTFIDNLGFEIVSLETVITDFDNPVILEDFDGNRIIFTYSSVVVLKK